MGTIYTLDFSLCRYYLNFDFEKIFLIQNIAHQKMFSRARVPFGKTSTEQVDTNVANRKKAVIKIRDLTLTEAQKQLTNHFKAGDGSKTFVLDLKPVLQAPTVEGEDDTRHEIAKQLDTILAPTAHVLTSEEKGTIVSHITAWADEESKVEDSEGATWPLTTRVDDRALTIAFTLGAKVPKPEPVQEEKTETVIDKE